MTDIDIDKLVNVYLKMQDKKTELETQFKQLEKQMRTVKVAINDFMRESKLDSVRSSAGLAYRTVKTTYMPTDWDLMHQFVIEHKLPQLLEKRLHQGNVKEYLEEHPDDPPPGLNANTEYSVTVKRNKNAK